VSPSACARALSETWTQPCRITSAVEYKCLHTVCQVYQALDWVITHAKGLTDVGHRQCRTFLERSSLPFSYLVHRNVLNIPTTSKLNHESVSGGSQHSSPRAVCRPVPSSVLLALRSMCPLASRRSQSSLRT